VVCDVRLLAREDVFPAFRVIPAVLFFERELFERVRVLSATAFAWIITPLLTVSSKTPKK
jgi:hypothetical protein